MQKQGSEAKGKWNKITGKEKENIEKQRARADNAGISRDNIFFLNQGGFDVWRPNNLGGKRWMRGDCWSKCHYLCVVELGWGEFHLIAWFCLIQQIFREGKKRKIGATEYYPLNGASLENRDLHWQIIMIVRNHDCSKVISVSSNWS